MAREAIRRVGLLPPLVALYEEEVEWLLPALVPHEDWSRAAAESLEAAFAHELPAVQLERVELEDEDPLIADLADLYAAVDFSVRRHVYGEFDEGFEERGLDYSLGSMAGWMERQGLDAVWIIAGTNLVPTGAAQVRDAVDTLLAVAGAAGGGGGASYVLHKLDLRAALIDREGRLLFFCLLHAGDIPREEQVEPRMPYAVDLRDPTFARRAVRQVLAEYSEARR